MNVAYAPVVQIDGVQIALSVTVIALDGFTLALVSVPVKVEVWLKTQKTSYRFAESARN